MVLGQGTKGVGNQGPARMRCGPVAVVPAVRDQPTGPCQHVDDEADDDDAHERGQRVTDQDALQRTPRTQLTAQLEVPEDGQQAEERHVPEPAPLDPARQAERQAGGDPPRTQPEPRPEDDGVALPQGAPGVRPAPDRIAIQEQEAERSQDEEHQGHVEQGRPAHHDVQPVEGHQQAGDGPDEVGPGEPADDPRGHQHAQRPEHRDPEPPSEGDNAEGVLASGDHPLAQRRMDDERGAVLEDVELVPRSVLGQDLVVRAVDRLALVPEPQERERVLHVVRLVEDDRVGPTEVDEPQHTRQDGDQQRPDPPAQPT